jgi:hypothetical protein
LIKINLLKNIGTANSPSGESKPRAAESSATAGSLNQQAVVKAVVLLLPIFILFGVEKYNISILNKKLADIAIKSAEIETQIKSYGNTGPDIEKYGAIKAKLEKQFDALQTIGGNRLREVKTLDNLQSVIPAHTWINEFSIDENSRALVQGFSETSDSAFSFVKAMEENANYSELTKIKVSTEANGAAGTKNADSFKKYSFEFRIGKAK